VLDQPTTAQLKKKEMGLMFPAMSSEGKSVTVLVKIEKAVFI
jgi:hypothetical protein